MARRKFNREFKISAVQLVNHQGYAVAEAARNLGIDPNSLRGWIKQFANEAGAAPPVMARWRRSCDGCARRTPG